MNEKSYKSKKSCHVDLRIPALGTMLISVFLSLLVLLNIVNYGSAYDEQIIKVVLVILFIWLLVFVIILFACRKESRISFRDWALCSFTFFALAVLLSRFVWDSGFLNLDPFGALARSNISDDPLLHAEMTLSLIYNGDVYRKINEAMQVGYHIGSHMIMAFISCFIGIHPLFSYSFIYPVLTIPLFVFLTMTASMLLRNVFRKEQAAKFSFVDVLLVFISISGILPFQIMNEMTIPKASAIISESHMFAVIFMLLYVNLIVLGHVRKWYGSKIYQIIFWFTISPIVIFVTTVTKVSMGLIICCSIMYFLIRANFKSIMYWGAIILNGVSLMIAYFSIQVRGVEVTALSPRGFMPFAFIRDFHPAEYQLWVWHYIVICLFSIVFLFLRLRKADSVIKVIKHKEYVIEEILFLVCLFGLLPGLIIHIAAGSALYFVFPQENLAIILLLGHDYPNRIYEKLKERLILGYRKLSRVIAYFVLILFYFSFILSGLSNPVEARDSLFSRWDNQEGFFSPNEFQYDTIIQMLVEIEAITRERPNEFMIFIDENSHLWIQMESSELIRAFTSYTGIVVVNAIYGVEDEQGDMNFYWRNGEPNEIGQFFPFQERMDLEEVLEYARNLDKESVIYLGGNGLEIQVFNTLDLEKEVIKINPFVSNYELGEVVDLSEFNPYLVNGWALPERWGVWSNGYVAEIYLNITEEVDNLTFLLYIEHIGTTDSIEVFLNDESLGEFEYVLGYNVIEIPVDYLEDGELRLRFEIASPTHTEGGRSLGIGVSHFVLSSD